MMKIRILGCSDGQLSNLKELSCEIGLVICDDATVVVRAVKGDYVGIDEIGGETVLTYSRPNELYRAFSMLPSYLESKKQMKQTARYKMLCYMADNSRNAVYNVASAKRMMRYLALMGYDSMMLYTEDTYEIPEYPYFGLMRGRFSEGELKELDDYAYSFGIELIPCIQTLAHLKTALRWPDFAGFKDTEDILMVGDSRTYDFVEASLRQLKKCFRSNKINLGMDEAHQIACGQYLKKNGYKKPSDVMLEHLEKVVKLCHDHGYSPMIWSDMFFRMQFNGNYMVESGSLDESVIKKVPDGLSLIYWDYYTINPAMFDNMLKCHEQFENEVLFAGGAWKWSGYGANNGFSLHVSKLHLDLCADHGVDRVIVTSWGDDGGTASQFSPLATLLYYAERDYSADASDDVLDKRSRECFGVSFNDILAFDLPDHIPGAIDIVSSHPQNPSNYLLFNDPFERLFDCHIQRDTAAAAFAANSQRLMSLSSERNFGYAFETLGRLCRVLSTKCDLGWRLHDAYLADDKDKLSDIAKNEIPQMVEELKAFIECFRKQWYYENKTYGFITQEIRLGGLVTRLESVAKRLVAYANGEIDAIDELVSEPLPINPRENGKYIMFKDWKKIVGAGII